MVPEGLSTTRCGEPQNTINTSKGVFFVCQKILRYSAAMTPRFSDSIDAMLNELPENHPDRNALIKRLAANEDVESIVSGLENHMHTLMGTPHKESHALADWMERAVNALRQKSPKEQTLPFKKPEAA